MPDVVRGRVVKSSRGMAEGLVWVEAYLPLDVPAFAEFSALVAKSGGVSQAAKADPALAERALAPIDAHGEAMLPADLQQLAHGFLADSRKMDADHAKDANGAFIPRSELTLVESFVNGPEVASPLYAPGAWVTVFRVEKGSDLWARLDAGQLDAVSFATRVTKEPVVARIQEVP